MSVDSASLRRPAKRYSVGLVRVGPTGYTFGYKAASGSNSPALKREIEMLALRWKPDVVLVEDKASGTSLLQELRVDTRLPISSIKGDTIKRTENAWYHLSSKAVAWFLPSRRRRLANSSRRSAFPPILTTPCEL